METTEQLEQLRRRNERLERELQRLLDREQITECIHNLARALDRLDRELLIAQYHPDAEVDYGSIYRGPVEGFIDVTMGFQGAMRDTQHLVGNILISLQGDIAQVESYVYAHHTLLAGDELAELIVGGRYLDRFERREGTWRIAFRTEVLDWGRQVSIRERWFERNTQLDKGRRDRQDRSYAVLNGLKPAAS